MGHGHVTPNPDGSKARCGGPALCSKCAQELAQLGQKSRERHERERLGKIADATKAEAQPLSPERWEAQQAELSRLCQAVQAAEVENQRLRARVAELEENERKTLELLKDGHSAHALILKGDIAVSRRQLAHLLGDAYQDFFNQTDGACAQPENPHNAPSVAQEVPVPVLAGDSASGKKYRLAWRKRGSNEAPSYSTWGNSKRHAESLVAEYNAVQPHIELWLEESQP